VLLVVAVLLTDVNGSQRWPGGGGGVWIPRRSLSDGADVDNGEQLSQQLPADQPLILYPLDEQSAGQLVKQPLDVASAPLHKRNCYRVFVTYGDRGYLLGL